jgi:aminoglycoside phosphotransferase (APT) family kinase protein
VDRLQLPRAVAACVAVANEFGLPVDDATVLNDSNRLAVHLRPCDALARVAPCSRLSGAQVELEIARRLAATGAPVAGLDPRVEPRVHEQDGFGVTLWTYHRPVPPTEMSPGEYGAALVRLHAGMRQVDTAGAGVPHFTDRVDEAQALVHDPRNNSAIGGADRELLVRTLRTMRSAVLAGGASEQLLHGEPHPGNVLRTEAGLLFVDLETCCLGPVEFDIAHATVSAGRPPTDVAAHYPGADRSLVRDCWVLMLAMVAAWRCEPGDDLPNGPVMVKEWIRQLRAFEPGAAT